MGSTTWTHCVNGHPFDEENTFIKNGYRACRTCCRQRNRESDRRRRERRREHERLIEEMPSISVNYAITKMVKGAYRAECHHVYPHGNMCDWAEDTVSPEYALRMLQNHMRRAHRVDGVTMRKAMSEG